MDKRRQELLGDLLKRVSRSFHLSLKFLPGQVREPISLAYLLARTSDTIADSNWLPLTERLQTLERFARRVSGSDASPVDFSHLACSQGDPAEGILLQRAEESLTLLDQLKDSDRALVKQVLSTIMGGQELDLKLFAGASESKIAALSTAEDLDDYTFRVAGCVGEFWTRICFQNLALNCSLSEAEMTRLGVCYGKGLQLVNILRDLPTDLRQGRCYIPATELEIVHLSPGALLNPVNEAALRPVYNAWLDRAHGYLADGWTYTNAYPRSEARVRISCALPVLIGLRTLKLLRNGPALHPASRIKIPRRQVRSLVIQAFLKHPFETRWQHLRADDE